MPTKTQVKDARLKAGLTQKEAAALVGMGLKGWQHYESGIRSMPPSKVLLFELQTGVKLG